MELVPEVVREITVQLPAIAVWIFELVRRRKPSPETETVTNPGWHSSSGDTCAG